MVRRGAFRRGRRPRDVLVRTSLSSSGCEIAYDGATAASFHLQFSPSLPRHSIPLTSPPPAPRPLPTSHRSAPRTPTAPPSPSPPIPLQSTPPLSLPRNHTPIPLVPASLPQQPMPAPAWRPLALKARARGVAGRTPRARRTAVTRRRRLICKGGGSDIGMGG